MYLVTLKSSFEGADVLPCSRVLRMRTTCISPTDKKYEKKNQNLLTLRWMEDNNFVSVCVGVCKVEHLLEFMGGSFIFYITNLSQQGFESLVLEIKNMQVQVCSREV